MASGTHFGRMAFLCMQLRLKIPPRLRAEFAVIEEAALKHALTQDKGGKAFACHVDESAGLAEVYELEERRRG